MWFFDTFYFLASIAFILGLMFMANPTTARQGIMAAGIAMLVAVLVSLFHPEVAVSWKKVILVIAALAVGSVPAWWYARKVGMTEMPQMIAIYNGVGGGAAGAIAGVELLRVVSQYGVVGAHAPTHGILLLAVVGAIIGMVSFSGSVIAWFKLDGRWKSQWLGKWLDCCGTNNPQTATQRVGSVAIVVGLILVALAGKGAFFNYVGVLVFFVAALGLGIAIAAPIGGGDMPVVISMFNAFTGLAVAFEGLVLNNYSLVVAGIMVGAAGSLLTLLMAKAMNRSIANVLFSGLGETSTGEGGSAEEGEMKEASAMDSAITMAYAENVIIVPGYGMAQAQAQHKVWELTQLLQDRGINVKFAIHPVAGRMPGHMNVLLAEAGVPYDLIFDLDEINNDFANTDAVLIIGANDVVNPGAKTDKSSPIYGMPVFNVEDAKNIFISKRGKGTGFSGISNPLFFMDNTRMVYGDAQKTIVDMVAEIKKL